MSTRRERVYYKIVVQPDCSIITIFGLVFFPVEGRDLDALQLSPTVMLNFSGTLMCFN